MRHLCVPDHAPEANKRIGHGPLGGDVLARLVVAVHIVCIHVISVGVVVDDGQQHARVVVCKNVAISDRETYAGKKKCVCVWDGCE